VLPSCLPEMITLDIGTPSIDENPVARSCSNTRSEPRAACPTLALLTNVASPRLSADLRSVCGRSSQMVSGFTRVSVVFPYGGGKCLMMCVQPGGELGDVERMASTTPATSAPERDRIRPPRPVPSRPSSGWISCFVVSALGRSDRWPSTWMR